MVGLVGLSPGGAMSRRDRDGSLAPGLSLRTRGGSVWAARFAPSPTRVPTRVGIVGCEPNLSDVAGPNARVRSSDEHRCLAPPPDRGSCRNPRGTRRWPVSRRPPRSASGLAFFRDVPTGLRGRAFSDDGVQGAECGAGLARNPRHRCWFLLKAGTTPLTSGPAIARRGNRVRGRGRPGLSALACDGGRPDGMQSDRAGRPTRLWNGPTKQKR